jgi:hypothetical protein
MLFSLQLSWGLPNGNSSWAADAIGPITSIGIVRRSFAEWNSGWYYFKYPLGYPFLLFLSAGPYLAWLLLTGGWRSPTSAYPYGFEDPERALFVMAMLGRCLNVAFALGVVVVTYGIARRLLGRWPARIAAFFLATAYPLIYYSHTTNLDISYLFWLLLALYAAIAAAASHRIEPWAVLGVAAAMAVSTKEQGFAFLLPLPILALGWRVAANGIAELWSRRSLVMAATAIATVIVANNLWYNPLGFVARIAYLLGRPLEPVAVRLAPVEFALWKGAKELVYVRQMWDGVESTLGTPVLCVAVVGLVALVLRHRTAAVWLLVPTAAQYYLSLRGLDLITLRYVLPISAILAILGGLALTETYRWAGARPCRVATVVLGVALAALAMARAVDMHWLLYADPRYRAEAWIEEHGRPGEIVEYYQKETYLPRFAGAVRGEHIEMDDRSIEAFQARRPWGALTSSASIKSIAHGWNPDWRETRDLLKAVPRALQFQDALARGELGYREAAVFRRDPALLRLRITSLAPEIVIYVRE